MYEEARTSKNSVCKGTEDFTIKVVYYQVSALSKNQFSFVMDKLAKCVQD